MTRQGISALWLGLVVSATIALGPASARQQPDREEQASAAPQALLLTGSAIVAAVRRTAVADPDVDGVVTGAEAARYYETRFSLLDENRDGTIDGAEFVRAVAVRSLYTVDGFAQPRPLAFESVDVDGDGKLTPEEFLRAELVRRSAFARGADARRHELFGVVDTDGDGLLTLHEFLNAGRRDFLGSDANRDGKISIFEFYSATRL